MTLLESTLRTSENGHFARCGHCFEPLRSRQLLPSDSLSSPSLLNPLSSPATAPAGDVQDYDAARFCCAGCEVASSLQATLGAAPHFSAAAAARPASSPALEGCVKRAVSVQGVHCSSCVWVIDRVFHAQAGAAQICVHPSRGVLEMVYDPRQFSADDFAKALKPFGYLLSERVLSGSAAGSDQAGTRGLLMRIGVCAALSLNSMAISFALYWGLATGPLHRLFGWVNWALATMALMVGGSLFLKSSWASVRQRVLHLDVPIALGIVSAYGGSLYYLYAQGAEHAYFDTLCGFITLMLCGKYLPQRILEKNRRMLLQDEGAGRLPQKRMGVNGQVEMITAAQIGAGDALLMAHGDLLCVPARLTSPQRAECSLEWITGESEPRLFGSDQVFTSDQEEPPLETVIPAGAFNLSGRALHVTAMSDFAASPLRTLLSSPLDFAARALQSDALKRSAQFSRIYVLTVLALAVGGLLAWLWIQPARALPVAISVLVVSCPCAIGLATPLAYDLAHYFLRQAGVYVRSADTLAKLQMVNHIAFDKTGTLTEAQMQVSNPEALDGLTALQRSALLTMVQSSNHPVCLAIGAALSGSAAAQLLDIEELPGLGVRACDAQGGRYWLGRDRASEAPSASVYFTINEVQVAQLQMAEQSRAGAAEEILALQRMNYSVSLISGDHALRVNAMKQSLGLNEAHSALTPEQKAEWVRAQSDRILFVGDGVNDLSAFTAAFASATPAIDRPFVPAKADFYYVAKGIRPIRMALRAAQQVLAAERFNYAFAFAYNFCVVGAALLGWMTPLIAAILMPVSSIFIVTRTLYAMQPPSAERESV